MHATPSASGPLALLAFNLATLSTVTAQPGGFRSTCGAPYISENQLWACCRNTAGQQYLSSLEFNRCFNNINGILQETNRAAPGNWQASCDLGSMVISPDGNFGVVCYGPDGSRVNTGAELNNYVYNQNGRLTCRGINGVQRGASQCRI